MKGRTNTGGGGGAYTLINVNTTDFIGKVVRCSDGGSYNKQTTFNSDGYAKFKVLMKGTYTISVTDGGQTYSDTVVVTEIGETYTTEINAMITLSIKVYSASNDTVYYMDNGKQVTLCTTNSAGSGTASISIQPSETKNITIYSTVAKDTNNASTIYSKVVSVNKNTTDIKVMPNGALYWYGNLCEWNSGGINKNAWLRSNTTSISYGTNQLVSASTVNENTALYPYASDFKTTGFTKAKIYAYDSLGRAFFVPVSSKTANPQWFSGSEIPTSWGIRAINVSNNMYVNPYTYGVAGCQITMRAFWFE